MLAAVHVSRDGPVELSFGIALVEGGALDRLQAGADAGGEHAVDDRLADIRKGGVAIERALN